MTIQYTHKTQYGNKARILCDNLQSEHNYVVAIKQNANESESVYFFQKDAYGNLTTGALTLTEASPWDDVPVDTPIWVRRIPGSPWVKRHLCMYKDGCVFAWDDGKTSHTVDVKELQYCRWEYATLENPNGN